MVFIISYNIHFIRHGMTEANIKGQYVGVTDIPVCEQGLKKLKNLKENYEYPKVDMYYSSPLIRCIQTGKIIYPNLEPVIVPDLKECNFGDWEGKTTDELSDIPDFITYIQSNRQKAPPNGESQSDFQKRVCTALENIINEIVKKGITSIGILAHGGVILTLLMTYSVEKFNMIDLMVENGCGFSVRVTPSIWMRDKLFEIYARVPKNFEGKISGNYEKMIKYSESILKK